MERVRGAGKGISEGEQGIKVGKEAGMGAWMRNINCMVKFSKK